MPLVRKHCHPPPPPYLYSCHISVGPDPPPPSRPETCAKGEQQFRRRSEVSTLFETFLNRTTSIPTHPPTTTTSLKKALPPSPPPLRPWVSNCNPPHDSCCADGPASFSALVDPPPVCVGGRVHGSAC